MASKAARGLGEGLARTGELLVLDSLARMRDEAVARIRHEQGMAESATEHGYRMKEGEFAAGKVAEENAKGRATQLEIARIAANARNRSGGLVKFVDLKMKDAFGNQTTETFAEITDPRTGIKARMPYREYDERYLSAAGRAPGLLEEAAQAPPKEPTQAPPKQSLNPFVQRSLTERERGHLVARDEFQRMIFEPVRGLIEPEPRTGEPPGNLQYR